MNPNALTRTSTLAISWSHAALLRTLNTGLQAISVYLIMTVALIPEARALDRLVKQGGFNGPVNAISEPDSEGTRYVGGDFTAYGEWLTGGGALVDTYEGSVNPSFPRVNGEVYSSVADGTGGFFIGGAFDAVDGIPRSNAAHIAADGSVDAWAPEPNGAVRAMAVVGTTVYMGGSFTLMGGLERNFAAAVAFSGTIDPSWKPQANGKVYALAAYDSKIYLGGAFTEINDLPRNHLAAVAINGELDTSWIPTTDDVVLTITNGSIATNAPQPEPPLIFVGGDFTEANGVVRNHAAAVSLDGTLHAWNPNVNGSVKALLCRTSNLQCGEVLIGGAFSQVAGTPRNNLAAWSYRYDAVYSKYFEALGSLNPNPNGPIYSITSRGWEVYIGGDFTEVGGASKKYAAVLDPDGGWLQSWQPDTNGPVRSISIEKKDGANVYIGGAFSTVRGDRIPFAAAVKSDGSLKSTWRPELSGPGGVDAVLLHDGTVFLGGRFTSAGWNERQGVAAFSTSAEIDPTFKPVVSGGDVKAIAAIGNKVFLGGTFTHVDDIPRNKLAALYRINGGVVLPWDAQIEGSGVSALASSDSTLFFGGNFYKVLGDSRNNAAAITEAGQLSPWDPNVSDQVRSLAVDGSVVYIGGDFTTVDGLPRGYVVAVGNDGAINETWQPMCNASVKAIRVSPSDVYLGGDFTHVNGENRDYIAAISKAGALRAEWSPTLNASVSALSTSESAIFVGGQFTQGGEGLSDYLALIDPVTGSNIPIPTATPTPLPTFTPTPTPIPIPTIEPEPAIAKPIVSWSPRYTTSVVRAFVTRVRGVQYSISGTSSGVEKKGRCSIDPRTRKVLCTVDLSKGSWLVSVTPHKQGATGRSTKRRFTFRR